MTLTAPTWTRRRVITAGAAALAAATPLARAQSGTPVRVLVGFAAGGSADQTARLVAEQLRQALGRPVVVENRTGAGGRVMLEQAKSAKPDGDTLVLVPHGPMTLFSHIYRSLRYAASDFAPVGRVCTFDYAVSTGPATPAKTLAEYLKWAADPAHKAAFGSPGPGTIPHLIGQMLAHQTGLPLVHVAYRGAAPSVLDTIAGNISLVSSPLADAWQHHQSGKLRVLATAGGKRTTFLPDVPTLKESGVDFVMEGWYGLYSRAGTPTAVIDTLSKALQAGAPAMTEPMARNALVSAPSTPAELATLQQAETAQWGEIVKQVGFKPED